MNKDINIQKLILDLVLADNYQPLKPKAIAKKLELLDDEKGVRRTIRKLVKAGRIAFGDRHMVVKPKSSKPPKPKKQKPKISDSTKTVTAFTTNQTDPESNDSAQTSDPESRSPKKNEVVGVFRRNSGGFGFVTPVDSTAIDRSDDIYVPRSKTADASDRDTVRIRISKSEGRRDRTSGRVIEVLERSRNRFVGTYSESGGMGIVTVDGNGFDSGILVGDAGAKNCKIDDKVVIEMVNFPSIREPGEGVIVEVLGDRGTPGVDTLMIIREYDLPESFPEDVLEDARQQAEAFDESIGDRTDFTNTTVVTIDPKTARDFDDAISLEHLENGHWSLGVHIADVSHFVPFRSKLDNEAYLRATSVYLPDRVIPMLPEIISNNLASLQPDRVRYCMTAIIEFSAEGVPIHTELHRGAIKSAHRFNYEEIDEYLADDQPWKEKLAPDVFRIVRDMHTLAMTLRKRRMDGGAIDLILPEVKIDLDDDGKVCGAHTVDNTESHQMIEEFMLAANEAVARRLADEKLYLMRRVHPKPTEAKLQDLTQFVRDLGIECESLESRFEVKRVIAESANMPEQHAIHFAVLRSMQKAIYSPEEIGHYALNSENYCHFTSPIRRYPDLIIHRMVGDLVDGKKPKSNFDRLAALGKHCSELEKRATEAERELTKLKLLGFMAERVGETMHAVLTGVESFGLFAQGIEIPAEGMIPIKNLPADKYQYDRGVRTLSGFKEGNQFRLGDTITVKIAVVDQDQRLLEFEIDGVAPSAGQTAKKSGQTHKKKHDSSKDSRSKSRNERGSDSKSKSNREKSKSKHSSHGDTRASDSKEKSKGKRKKKTKVSDSSRSKKKTRSKSKSPKSEKK